MYLSFCVRAPFVSSIHIMCLPHHCDNAILADSFEALGRALGLLTSRSSKNNNSLLSSCCDVPKMTTRSFLGKSERFFS